MHFQNLRVSAKPANMVGAVFYTTVAVIALAGQTIAASEWLGWDVFYAAGAAAALELGGIALAAHADLRRRVGERAVAARALSAAVALFAIWFNWVGHRDHRQAAFFAGMSALGYSVWLIQSGARRRDQMRSDKTLAPTAPVYGWLRWVRHPMATWRARSLFLVTPELGLYGSLAAVVDEDRAARDQARVKTRQGLVSRVLQAKLKAAAVTPLDAELAVAVFDLDIVAQNLTDGADYKGLAKMLMADLVPARILAQPEPTIVQQVQAAALPAPTSPAPAGIGHLLAPQPERAPRPPALRVTGRTTLHAPVASLLNAGRELVPSRLVEITDRED